MHITCARADEPSRRLPLGGGVHHLPLRRGLRCHLGAVPAADGILARAAHHVEYDAMRELYFRLCDQPLLIDGGRMSFSLEKSTGAKCYMLSARELFIMSGDVPMCWRWVYLPNLRFSEIAELLDIRWMEISGKIESGLLSQKKTYAAFLVYKVTDMSYGLYHPFQAAAVKFGGHSSRNMVQLSYSSTWYDQVTRRRLREADANIRTPQQRYDGWMDLELGEFHNDEREDGEVEISLKEVIGGNCKSGLLIRGIEIRPKTEY